MSVKKTLSKNKPPLRLKVVRGHLENEVFGFNIKFKQIYTILTMWLVSALILGYLVFQYSPLKTFINSQNSGVDVNEYDELKLQIIDLRKRIEAQSLYVENAKALIQGEIIALDTPQIQNEPHLSQQKVERIGLDEELRKRVDVSSSMKLSERRPAFVSSEDESRVEDEFLIPPLTGFVSLAFNPLKSHFGIDVLGTAKTAIKCCLDGQVLLTDWTLEDGNTIVVQHDYNLVTIYKHNSALLKKKGDRVKAGEAIAIIGNTGIHTNGPHLHFELWKNGQALDPAEYIRF